MPQAEKRIPTYGGGHHPLELGPLLGTAPALLLVAGGDGESPALAVCFLLAYLLGDGGLVLPVLALVRDAGIGGRPVHFLLVILPITASLRLSSAVGVSKQVR